MSAQDFGGFQAQPLDLQNQKNQRLFRILFLLMTVILILPVVIILMLLVSKGAPALSWAFFTENPVNGMTEGGIFPALVGTLWIVAVALIASVPLGVAAAIYLSEYASDNALTRAINLAIINLAGVPSIVHALFGVGAFEDAQIRLGPPSAEGGIVNRELARAPAVVDHAHAAGIFVDHVVRTVKIQKLRT